MYSKWKLVRFPLFFALFWTGLLRRDRTTGNAPRDALDGFSVAVGGVVSILNDEKRPMNQELLRIVDNIARDKNIDKESIFADLEEAMVSAVRKHFYQAIT